jgi:hypothetical protein
LQPGFYRFSNMFDSRQQSVWKWATATGGLVAIGWVRLGSSFFSGPCNRTFKHYIERSYVHQRQSVTRHGILKRLPNLSETVPRNSQTSKLKLCGLCPTWDLGERRDGPPGYSPGKTKTLAAATSSTGETSETSSERTLRRPMPMFLLWISLNPRRVWSAHRAYAKWGFSPGQRVIGTPSLSSSNRFSVLSQACRWNYWNRWTCWENSSHARFS